MTDTNEVYEWGFLDGRSQFEKLLELPVGQSVRQVAIGLEHNIFLMKSGQAYMSGAISQGRVDVEHFMDTMRSEILLDLNEQLLFYEQIDTKFETVRCGYHHAVLVDIEGRIYSFGAGLAGQLGLGPDLEISRHPNPIAMINDSSDRVTLISCGPKSSLAYTELGILYAWGTIVPSQPENIQWYPSFFHVSIPQEDYELDDSYLYEFHLTDLQSSYRELLACDSKGRVYHCDLATNQTLKVELTVSAAVGPSFKCLMGRDAQFFLSQLICPENCKFEVLGLDDVDRWQSEGQGLQEEHDATESAEDNGECNISWDNEDEEQVN